MGGFSSFAPPCLLHLQYRLLLASLCIFTAFSRKCFLSLSHITRLDDLKRFNSRRFERLRLPLLQSKIQDKKHHATIQPRQDSYERQSDRRSRQDSQYHLSSNRSSHTQTPPSCPP